MKEQFIYALGFFDGVHIGHQALLKECRRMAAQKSCETAAITFESHPQSLFTSAPPALINTLQDRSGLLLGFGMEHIYSFPVTKEVMGKHWRTFLDELVEHGAVGFVCGQDFRFGSGGEGDAEKLLQYAQENHMLCRIVEDQTLDGVRVSSTHIRKLLEEGRMAEAMRFLGHAHRLTGEVISGRQLGRTIGVPTANLRLPEGVVCPKFGVYACKAIVDAEEYLAVTNIGTRPTVDGDHVTVEAHLLDFAGDLYGKALSLQFYEFLRPEQKFDSLEALQAEIQKNALQTRKIFEKT